MPQENLDNQRSRVAISPKEIIFRYIHFLPWVVLSVTVALVGAYIKLRYSAPIYSVSGKLLVSNQSPQSGGGGDKFDDIFMMSQRVDKLNDEIEIIKSRNMAARVIRSLGMQKQVYNVGKIRTSIIYPGIVPFNFEILSIVDSAVGFSVAISFTDDNQFRCHKNISTMKK
jgi:uncharacterized protein involved in exopolysaccharide biosynthesis